MNESSERSPGSVMMLSGDLMFSSRVKAAAQRCGRSFRMGGELPTDETSEIQFVVLDLSTRSKLIPVIAEQCQQRCPQAKLIAFGPHVQVDKLRAARDAGIAHVLTNGQFNGQLASLFET